MLSTHTLDRRFELARRVGVPLAVALWISSAATPQLGVSGQWFVPLLALSLSAIALPTAAVSPTSHPRPWTAVGLSVAVAFVGGIRTSIGAERGEVLALMLALICGESMVAVIPAAIGQWIDRFLAPRLERGRGRMRHVSLAAAVVATCLAGAALSRFSGRAEPTHGTTSERSTMTKLGVFQPLGARCPIRCDEGPRGVRRDRTNLIASIITDELLGGVTLERRRLDAMNTRARLMVTPDGSAPRYVFERVLPPGQPLTVSIDASRRHLVLELGHHPKTIVRLSDGELFTERTSYEVRETSFHAPTVYVLGALSGVALAAWLLLQSRRARRAILEQDAWRDATVGEDRMILFEKDLPPARMPDWFAGQVRHVVVTSLTAPAGVGYRSDGVVTIHSMFAGSRADLITHLTIRATALEHAAFATVALTVAPLVGVWVAGEAW